MFNHLIALLAMLFAFNTPAKPVAGPQECHRPRPHVHRTPTVPKRIPEPPPFPPVVASQ